MVAVSYVVDNDRKFRDAINRAQQACADLRVPFGLILSDFYKSEKSIFGLKSPGKYPDFKNGGPESRYAKLKQKEVGFKYPLLVKTGALAASLLSKNAPGSIAQITYNSLTVGTAIQYGIYHQSDQPRHRIPLRKFLFIGPEAPTFATSEMQGRPERWFNIMNDYVLKSIQRSGMVKV